MNGYTSSAPHTDDHLLAVMDQTADWTVNGRAGCVLATLHSLRDALRAVFECEAAGHHVFAVCGQSGEAIVVFHEQVERLADAVGMQERDPRRKAA